MHCQSSSAHGPVVPRAPSAGIPLGHPCRWFGFGAFLALFFGPQGGYLRPWAKTVISDAQGGTRGVWGWKGAVQGPPMDPSDGPIAGLVERDTLILTLRSGYAYAYGAARPPPWGKIRVVKADRLS